MLNNLDLIPTGDYTELCKMQKEITDKKIDDVVNKKKIEQSPHEKKDVVGLDSAKSKEKEKKIANDLVINIDLIQTSHNYTQADHKKNIANIHQILESNKCDQEYRKDLIEIIEIFSTICHGKISDSQKEITLYTQDEKQIKILPITQSFKEDIGINTNIFRLKELQKLTKNLADLTQKNASPILQPTLAQICDNILEQTKEIADSSANLINNALESAIYLNEQKPEAEQQQKLTITTLYDKVRIDINNNLTLTTSHATELLETINQLDSSRKEVLKQLNNVANQQIEACSQENIFNNKIEKVKELIEKLDNKVTEEITQFDKLFENSTLSTFNIKEYDDDLTKINSLLDDIREYSKLSNDAAERPFIEKENYTQLSYKIKDFTKAIENINKHAKTLKEKRGKLNEMKQSELEFVNKLTKEYTSKTYPTKIDFFITTIRTNSRVKKENFKIRTGSEDQEKNDIKRFNYVTKQYENILREAEELNNDRKHKIEKLVENFFKLTEQKSQEITLIKQEISELYGSFENEENEKKNITSITKFLQKLNEFNDQKHILEIQDAKKLASLLRSWLINIPETIVKNIESIQNNIKQINAIKHNLTPEEINSYISHVLNNKLKEEEIIGSFQHILKNLKEQSQNLKSKLSSKINQNNAQINSKINWHYDEESSLNIIKINLKDDYDYQNFILNTKQEFILNTKQKIEKVLSMIKTVDNQLKEKITLSEVKVVEEKLNNYDLILKGIKYSSESYITEFFQNGKLVTENKNLLETEKLITDSYQAVIQELKYTATDLIQVDKEIEQTIKQFEDQDQPLLNELFLNYSHKSQIPANKNLEKLTFLQNQIAAQDQNLKILDEVHSQLSLEYLDKNKYGVKYLLYEIYQKNPMEADYINPAKNADFMFKLAEIQNKYQNSKLSNYDSDNKMLFLPAYKDLLKEYKFDLSGEIQQIDSKEKIPNFILSTILENKDLAKFNSKIIEKVELISAKMVELIQEDLNESNFKSAAEFKNILNTISKSDSELIIKLIPQLPEISKAIAKNKDTEKLRYANENISSLPAIQNIPILNDLPIEELRKIVNTFDNIRIKYPAILDDNLLDKIESHVRNADDLMQDIYPKYLSDKQLSISNSNQVIDHTQYLHQNPSNNIIVQNKISTEEEFKSSIEKPKSSKQNSGPIIELINQLPLPQIKKAKNESKIDTENLKFNENKNNQNSLIIEKITISNALPIKNLSKTVNEFDTIKTKSSVILDKNPSEIRESNVKNVNISNNNNSQYLKLNDAEQYYIKPIQILNDQQILENQVETQKFFQYIESLKTISKNKETQEKLNIILQVNSNLVEIKEILALASQKFENLHDQQPIKNPLLPTLIIDNNKFKDSNIINNRSSNEIILLDRYGSRIIHKPKSSTFNNEKFKESSLNHFNSDLYTLAQDNIDIPKPKTNQMLEYLKKQILLNMLIRKKKKNTSRG